LIQLLRSIAPLALVSVNQFQPWQQCVRTHAAASRPPPSALSAPSPPCTHTHTQPPFNNHQRWQVIIAGSTANPATIGLLNAAHAAWAPDKAVILIGEFGGGQGRVSRLTKLAVQRTPVTIKTLALHQLLAPNPLSHHHATTDPADPESATFWQTHNPQAWAMVAAHFAKAEAAAGGVSAAGVRGDAMASEVAAAGGADDAAVTPTAFVCANYTCQAPTTSSERLYEVLVSSSGARSAGSGGVTLTRMQL
jgi:hypothetical protein